MYVYVYILFADYRNNILIFLSLMILTDGDSDNLGESYYREARPGYWFR